MIYSVHYTVSFFAVWCVLTNKIWINQSILRWLYSLWYSKLLVWSCHTPVELPDKLILLSQEGGFHDSPDIYKLIVWFISGDVMRQEKFHTEFSLQCSQPRNSNMEFICKLFGVFIHWCLQREFYSTAIIVLILLIFFSGDGISLVLHSTSSYLLYSYCLP